jgi:predicted acyl esterase
MVPFSPPLPAWRRRLGLLLGGALSLGTLVMAADAQAPAPSAQLVAAREAQERELRELAEVHRSVMMPMRDGTRLMTDVYVPRQRPASGVPFILRKTPYNMNWWDVHHGGATSSSITLSVVQARR